MRRASVLAAVAALALSLAPASIAELAPGSVGYDVSYPQCNQPLPGGGAFAVVGVNAGLPFAANPCLASQLQWAGPGAELYANTANPGPARSAHWPNGQTAPQPCNTATVPGNDTAGCAYDYGWNAAQDSFADAAGFAATAWWLDVETENTWEANAANNVAALQGAVDYLKSAGVTAIGFYAAPAAWQTITGSTTQFSGYPFWLPGATSLADAQARCAAVAPNGGSIVRVQFPQAGLSADTVCAIQPRLTLAAPKRTTANGASAAIVVQLPQAAAGPVTVTLSSSSASGRFAAAATGPWTPTLRIGVPAGATTSAPFYYRARWPGRRSSPRARPATSPRRRHLRSLLPPVSFRRRAIADSRSRSRRPPPGRRRSGSPRDCAPSTFAC